MPKFSRMGHSWPRKALKQTPTRENFMQKEISNEKTRTKKLESLIE